MFFTISTQAQKLERRRLQAGRYFNGGKTQAWVAEKMSVTTAATCKWYASWKKNDLQGLKSKGRCGAKKKLTREKLRKIDQALLKGPEKNGFHSPLWTLERVTRVMKKQARVSYHPGHAWKILRSLGWTNQKPVRRARERNTSAIQRWHKEVWPTLKKGGVESKLPLVSSTKQDFLIVR